MEYETDYLSLRDAFSQALSIADPDWTTIGIDFEGEYKIWVHRFFKKIKNVNPPINPSVSGNQV